VRGRFPNSFRVGRITATFGFLPADWAKVNVDDPVKVAGPDDGTIRVLYKAEYKLEGAY